MRLRLSALTAVSALVLAAPASPSVAPGRVVFPLRSATKVASVDPVGLEVGVARPDGGATLAGVERGAGVVLAQLRADGSLDPSFGTGGAAHIPLPLAPGSVGPTPLQLLRQIAGRLVLVVAALRAHHGRLRAAIRLGTTPVGHITLRA